MSYKDTRSSSSSMEGNKGVVFSIPGFSYFQK